MVRHVRSGRLVQTLRGGENDSREVRERAVVCPKCEAKVGWRCHRMVGDRQVWLKTVHKERKGLTSGGRNRRSGDL